MNASSPAPHVAPVRAVRKERCLLPAPAARAAARADARAGRPLRGLRRFFSVVDLAAIDYGLEQREVIDALWPR